MKLGVAVFAPVSVTAGLPPVWLHDQVSGGAPSGAVERLPSRRTVSPSPTTWSGPASAISTRGSTVTATVSVSVAPPAVTVSVNVSVTSTVVNGAVKPGVAVFAPVSVTFGLPPVWLHDQLSDSPSGSKERRPSRRTALASYTVWSGPASAVGSSLSAWTVTTTVSVMVSLPTVTVSVNVRSSFASRLGAVKLGVAVAAPVRRTVEAPPAVWRHE